MKSNILQKMRVLAVLVLTVFVSTLTAQDLNKAGEVFNEGNQAVKADNYELAIEKYQEALEIASQLGAEGEQIATSAKSSIPSLYYKMGIQNYKEKNIDKAIGEFEKAITYGNEYGDQETTAKATDIIPKLYYAKGTSLYKENKYQEALESFNQSAEMAPDYSRAYWGMGLAYNKLDQSMKVDEAFAKALELARTEGDEKMANKISATAKKLLQGEGATKLQTQEWDQAIELVNASLKYDVNDKDSYYYLALANNGLGKHDDAIVAALKGLELSADENAEYKAKFYYELGNAYKGKGDNTQACEAYTNAKHGRFVESADYELKTVLNCN
ncbi:MAG: tetratricopeptide repeat protein [Bacteroidales bacterium]